MVALDHSSGEVPPANVMELNSHLLCSFSGGSEASRGYLLDHLPDKCRKLELKEGRKASAAEASEWLAEFLSLHPDSDCSFSLGILIAGWGNESGPGLYKVKGNGKRLKVTDSWAGTGCAANLAVIIDSTDRTIKDITVEKSAELAKRTLSMAVYHAHECRECVSAYHVGSTGVKLVVRNENIVKLQKRYLREVGRKWEDMRRENEAQAFNWAALNCHNRPRALWGRIG
ncbi:OLC1v1006818C2 [Oldenlandia corymbosa var. corymbosa]|uniref:OLC1v1006818C2 n=1 Tax=Oldenlandia corymbosa var. corymbosa TaxID=529605 RepID=A0AAV1DI86_OLDCO|nr:OLC1v1006818C2 [Oldenlandia corymbosa var. corymbosa]